MCGCCSGPSRPVSCANGGTLAVTAGAASPGKNSGASTPSSSTAASSGAHHDVCCCGLSVLGVIRLSFLLALLMALIFSLLFFREAKDFFLDTLTYVNELGPVRGSLVLCIANIIGALLFMPCVPFTLGAGFLYGTLIGSVVVSIASTVAAVIAFLSARYLARTWIERTCLGGRASKFRILDQAIREDGFRIVLLIRSSPLHPYGVMNYAFGITAVTARDYTVASFIGMLPSTVMEVYFGSATKTVGAIIQGNVDNSMLSRIFFWAGLGCTVVVTVLLTVILKRKLRTEMDKYQAVATEGDDDEDDDFGLMAGLGSAGGADHPHHPIGARDSAIELHEPALSDTEMTPALSKSSVASRLESPDNRSRKSSESSSLSVALPASARRQHKLSASSVHSGIHAALSTPISTPVLTAAPSSPLKPPSDLSLHSHAHHSSSPHSHGHTIGAGVPPLPPPPMRDEEDILDEHESLLCTKHV